MMIMGGWGDLVSVQGHLFSIVILTRVHGQSLGCVLSLLCEGIWNSQPHPSHLGTSVGTINWAAPSHLD